MNVSYSNNFRHKFYYIHTIVICGKGQVSLLLAMNVLLAEQDSVTTQLLES